MHQYVKFSYSGKFAHFLKAEANASCPSYRVPPRTVLLGMIGAILGLPKDSPQIELESARIAVYGNGTGTYWHKGNFRKDPPAPLPYTVKKNQKGSSALSKNTRLNQEWIINPHYTVWASLPENHHNTFKRRIEQEEWHYSPYMGISELFAKVEFIDSGTVTPLEKGLYNSLGVIRRHEADIELKIANTEKIVIHPITMPRSVTQNREFSHEFYYWEPDGNPIPVATAQAWKAGKDIIMWL